jgi:hypothetical protein
LTNYSCSVTTELQSDWEFSSQRDFLGLRKGMLIDYELLKNANVQLSSRITDAGNTLAHIVVNDQFEHIRIKNEINEQC